MSRQNLMQKWHELAVGAAITEPGSARSYKTGTWRSSHPVWNGKECVRCGLCSIYCPEGCIAFGGPEDRPAADLNYCKGCGICAHECPTGCIRMEEE